MADRVGQQLGNYRLTHLLGRGGFAEVYLGEHLRLKTQAAIKVLHTSLEDDDVEDFLKEAQTVARLKHPHIVRVFDFDVEEHIPFLVMDYLSNGNVRRSHPKGTPLPLMTIVSYVNQVASALQYAHDEHLIHRDIKPENMLLDQHNMAVLSDFGIALMTQSSRHQSTQEVVGTAAYMAPEQFQGKPRRASDQYGLGIVVYEWLCGSFPFHGSFTEIASQHLFVSPQPLREKLPTLPSDIEEVVFTALSKDPQQRFASIKAFARAFEQACRRVPSYLVSLPSEDLILPNPPSLSAGGGVTLSSSQTSPSMNRDTPQDQKLQPKAVSTASFAPTITPPTHSELVLSGELYSPKRRISRRAVMISLAGLAVAGGGITWLALYRSTHISSGSIPTATATPAPLGTLFYTYHGHSAGVWSVAWSPDGKYIASGSRDTTVQVWNTADGGQVYTYRGHSLPVTKVAWSPDGNHIASTSDDGTFRVWDATTGRDIFTHNTGLHGHAVAWSPDGTHLATGGDNGTVQVWNTANWSNIYTYHGHSGAVWWVTWSPDGKYIASASHDTTVQVWNAADGGDVYIYRGHTNVVWAVAWSPDGTRIASASWDGTVQVWNTADGGHIYTYRGHSDIVRDVEWSRDSKRLATGDDDGTVQVWNTANWSNIYTYRGHSGGLNSAQWSPDGTRIASGSDDMTVQIWQAV